MINITFYNFSKKPNSTKRPTGGTSVACLIKSSSSIINPVIQVKTDPTGYNYCYIAAFTRYYFINDIVFDNGIWLVYCSVDVLATYKTEIGNTDQYILRSSARKNTNIVDNLYPLTTNFTEVWSRPYINDMTWSGFDHGVYILGVQGNQSGNTGIMYYEVEPAQFKLLMDTFWGLAGDSGAIARYGELMANSLLNLSDYIVSCIWLPGSITLPTQTYEQVKLGNIVVCAGKACGSAVTEWRVTFTQLSEHPQINNGQYMHYPPFSQYTLIVPWLGNINIPYSWLSNVVNQGLVLQLKAVPDYTTGEGVIRVIKWDDNLQQEVDVVQFKTQLGVNIPISTLELNIGTLAGVTGGIGSVISGILNGNAGQIGAGVMSGIGNAADLYNPESRLITGASGYIKYGLLPVLHCKYALTAQHDNDLHGSPCCQTLKPGNIGGYILCDNAVFEYGLEDERRSVISYLNSGVFYE